MFSGLEFESLFLISEHRINRIFSWSYLETVLSLFIDISSPLFTGTLQINGDLLLFGSVILALAVHPQFPAQMQLREHQIRDLLQKHCDRDIG